MKALTLVPLTSPAQILGVQPDVLKVVISEDPSVTYYVRYLGSVVRVNVSVFQNVEHSAIQTNITHEKGGDSNHIFFLSVKDGKIRLVKTDDLNVRRCSNDPEIASRVQHWS